MDPLQNTRMFEIPFWSLKCTDWENKKRQFKDVLKTYPGVREGAQTFLSNRNTNLEGLTDCFLNLFREEMTRISHNFKRDLAVLDSWSVTYETGDYHAPHNHGNKGLSGILYVDLPEGAPGTTYIQPFPSWQDEKTLSREPYVEEGMMMIVPRHLLHFSNPNKSQYNKTIFSWDFT